jgi:putative hydrolase of the HAD superfamily
MIRVVTFDAAGTLIRLTRPPGVTYAECAGAFGYRLDSGRLQKAFRSTWRSLDPPAESSGPKPDDDRGWWKELVRQTLLKAGYDLELFDDYFEHVYAAFEQVGAWELFPDIPEILAELRRTGIRLGVISNFDRRLYTVLRHLDVLRAFECVVISSEIGASKPSGRIFMEAARRFGVQPAEILHVGDDAELDAKGALAAGFRSCLINHESDRMKIVLNLIR